MTHRPLRIVHVIARMNVGGPAILISELIKGLNKDEFESYLITGFCEDNEVEFEVAATLISDNLKSKIQIEAESLNFLPKSNTTKLPL